MYDLNYSKNIRIVRDYFKSIDVELLGRFAEFEYINWDDSASRLSALQAFGLTATDTAR